MKRFVVLAVILSAFTASAFAGPLATKDVGADAKWFGHVNFEAIRAMKLVQDLKEKCPAKEKCRAKVEELSAKLGLNPLEDIQGATLYSTRFGGQAGVVLVYVGKKLDREKLVGLLKQKHPDHKAAQYGSRTLYGWSVSHRGEKMELTGTFGNDQVVVLGADAEQVKAAVDVLDGKRPPLAKDAPLVKGIPRNALFASRALDVPEDYRSATHCPVLRNCKSALALWTEKDGQITGKYDFVTVSDETAKSFQAIVDGLKAMANLRFGSLPEVKKVLDGLKSKAKGENFSATFTASTADLEAAAKAAIARKREAGCPVCPKKPEPDKK